MGQLWCIKEQKKLKTGGDQNGQAPKTQQQRGRLQISHLHLYCHGYGHFRSGGTRLEEPRGSEINQVVQSRLNDGVTFVIWDKQ
jgi:hypothetical protein